MSFDTLRATYDVAVSRYDLVTQRAVIEALHKLAKTNSILPAWVTALGIEPAKPAVTAELGTPGTPRASALERAIADANAQRLLTPSAFGAVDDAALDRALLLDPVMHTVASQAIARLTIAARALRPPGVETPAHVEWRAKNDAIQAKVAAIRVYPEPPGVNALAAALLSTIPYPEPPFDDGGGAAAVDEHATALGAVVALLG